MKACMSKLAKRMLQAGVRIPAMGQPFEFEGKTYIAKRLAPAVLAVLLTGCAMPGLSINADFTVNGTYRSDVPLGERLR